MSDYSHFEKGIQYSHYTGTVRTEIICAADLLANSDTEEERKQWADYLKQQTTELTNILNRLDSINNFK